jgi:starvation-inducible DNA-binding protein
MTTQDQLTQIFCDNFVGYYRSHVAHVNITGRNFYSDHKLLKKIYESLQGEIDSIAELLRTLDEFMPMEVQHVLNESHISTGIMDGSSDTLLDNVLVDLEHLKAEHEALVSISTEEHYDEIANYAQDRVLTLSKQIWMLRSTLE